MKEKKISVITCPCCGAEYLPGEIYLPNYFVGQPKIIERDSFTKKIMWCDKEMDLNEHFVCENCNTPFFVTAKVIFSVQEDSSNNYNQDYTTSLKKQPLFSLSED